tara:strand:+ start:448 stop:588 length:141 start_codon:yes stop_codon:yes gene_type:complete
VSSVDVIPPPSKPEHDEELCRICSMPLRDHSFEQQKVCAEKLRGSK